MRFTLALLLTSYGSATNSSSSLRGIESKVDSPFGIFSCSLEGKLDKTACSAAKTSDGRPCSYCITTGKDDEESGLCVAPEIAQEMGTMNKQISCTGSDEVALNSENMQNPFSQLKCTFEGRMGKENCEAAANDDGKACSYCTKDGAEEGLCVDPEVAVGVEAKEDDISCTNTDVGAHSLLRSSARNKNLNEQPFDELKCMFEGRMNPDKCSDLFNKDGDKCNFCTLSEDGKEASLCVDPQVATQMKQLNPNVSCTSSDLETSDVGGPFSQLKCTFKGFMDKDKCAVAVNDDGKACSYCTKDGAEGGLCVDPEVAVGMEEKNDDISCTNTTATTALETSDVGGPFSQLKCTFEGFMDKDKCAVAANDDGKACSYCTKDGAEGGLCVDPEVAVGMEEKNNDISCTNTTDLSAFDSNCYKVGLHGGTSDDCESTVDESSGENCIFCNAPRLDGIGLCMPSEFKGKEGHFYSCNGGAILSSY